MFCKIGLDMLRVHFLFQLETFKTMDTDEDGFVSFSFTQVGLNCSLVISIQNASLSVVQ